MISIIDLYTRATVTWINRNQITLTYRDVNTYEEFIDIESRHMDMGDFPISAKYDPETHTAYMTFSV